MKRNVFFKEVCMPIIREGLKLFFLFTLMGTISILTSCAHSGKSEPSTSVDIYIAGQFHNGSFDVAVYWLNDVMTILSTEESYASSIWIDGTDVYVGGACKEGDIKIACYWKNGVKETLDTTASGLNSIMVSEADVYAAGSSKLPGTGSYTACYWKNKIKTNIWDNNAKAEDLHVTGNEVYIAGTYYNWGSNNWTAGYWKNNGERIDLPGYRTVVSGIQVVGSDIYVGGECEHGDHPIPCYWKNGLRIDMEGSAQVYSLFVSGNTVYAVGAYLNSKDDWVACYWENGKIHNLPGDNAGAHDISVIGDDIYIVGNCGWGSRSACYWVNEKKKDLEADAYADKVFVKPIF